MAALLFYYSHHKFFKYKVLFIYYAGAALLLYGGIVFSDNNFWTYNLLFFINICISSWYFWLLCGKSKKAVIALCWVLNTLLFVYTDLLQGKFDRYNSFVYGISFITLVLYSLFYLYELLAEVKEGNLLWNFDFWLVCGYLLYFLGSFIIVLYYNDTTSIIQRGNLWAMHNLILFICSLITLFVSLRIPKKRIVFYG